MVEAILPEELRDRVVLSSNKTKKDTFPINAPTNPKLEPTKKFVSEIEKNAISADLSSKFTQLTKETDEKGKITYTFPLGKERYSLENDEFINIGGNSWTFPSCAKFLEGEEYKNLKKSYAKNDCEILDQNCEYHS